jgi:hypothetical protein
LIIQHVVQTATRDFYLFLTLKKFLGSRPFESDEEVEEAVNEWLNGLAAEIYEEGTQNTSQAVTNA